MKKIFSLIVALFVLSACLLGCGQNSESNASNNGSVDNNQNVVLDVELSKDDVAFVNADNKSVYKIVAPQKSLNMEDQLSVTVAKYMKSLLGVSIETIDDSVSTNGSYEILIGDTNRSESVLGLNYLFNKTGGHYEDYVICTIGKCIVINAFNSDALKKACDYFVDSYLRNEGVKGGIDFCYAVEGDFKAISVNGVGIGQYRIVRPHFNTSYLTQTEIDRLSETLYQSYGYKLTVEEDDYTEPFKYEINVGDNNRDGVSRILNHDEYRIEIKGNKVFLNGGSAHATAMAVSEFGKLLKKGSVTDADSVTGSYKSAIASYDKKTTYTPTWYDTFDGDVLDTSKWRLMNKGEFGRDGQNGKRSLMSDDPEYVYQKDGKFYINAQDKEDAYYGGCILNDNIMVFRYGYVEMSALCPDGPGFWSLIYFYQPDDSKAGPFTGANLGYYRPEIDLNECFGNGRMTYFNCHAHINVKGELAGKEHISFDNSPYKNDRIYHCPDGKTFSDNLHTYGLIWDETQMTMVADGKVHFKYEFSTEYDIDAFVETYLCMKVAFSVARENNNLDINEVTEEQWENSSTMIVDYVYLYQFDDGIQDIIYLK